MTRRIAELDVPLPDLLRQLHAANRCPLQAPFRELHLHHPPQGGVVNLSETYRKAAQVIRINGHYKGAYWGRPEGSVGVEPTASESPVCAVGALSVAVTGHPTPTVDDVDPVIVDFASRMFGPVNEAAAVVRIAAWNDADERTAADVIDLFERFAREVA